MERKRSEDHLPPLLPLLSPLSPNHHLLVSVLRLPSSLLSPSPPLHPSAAVSALGVPQGDGEAVGRPYLTAARMAQRHTSVASAQGTEATQDILRIGAPFFKDVQA